MICYHFSQVLRELYNVIRSLFRRLMEFIGLRSAGPSPEHAQISNLCGQFDSAITQGDRGAAESIFRELRDFVDRLKGQALSLEVQSALASGHYNLAMSAVRLGDIAEAESMFEQSRYWLQPLRRQSYYQKNADFLYAASENMQGLMYLNRRMFENAAARFESAIAHRSGMRQRNPDDQENGVYLAGAMINLAHVQRECGRPDEARHGYTQAIELLNEACPACECGCRETLIAALRLSGASHQWVQQSDHFREVAQWGLSQLESNLPDPNN